MRVCWHTNFFHDAWVIQLNVNHQKPWDSVCIASQVNFTTMNRPIHRFRTAPRTVSLWMLPASSCDWQSMEANSTQWECCWNKWNLWRSGLVHKTSNWKFWTKKWSRFQFSIWRIKFQQKNTKTMCFNFSEFDLPNFGSSQTFPLPTQLGYEPRWNHPGFWPKAPGLRLRCSREGVEAGFWWIFVVFFLFLCLLKFGKASFFGKQRDT